MAPTYETPMIPRSFRFTLDGEPIDIDNFLEGNARWMGIHEVEAIASLSIGEEIVYGGGAAPEFVLRRVT